MKQITSIRNTMIIFFFFLILVVSFVFMGISMRATEEAVLLNSTEYTAQLVEQVNHDIDAYINYMENIAIIVLSGEDVKQYLSLKKSDNKKEEELKQRIIKQFKTIMNMREYITNIAIVSTDGKIILNIGTDEINPYIQINKTDWYKKAVEADEHRVLSSSHVQNLIEDEYRWVVTLSKSIKEKENNQTLGVVMVDLSYRAITNLCKMINIGNRGYVFLIDEDGQVIYHPQQQLIYTGIRKEYIPQILNSTKDYFIVKEGKENKLYTFKKSEKTKWTVVGVAYIDELIGNKKRTNWAYFSMAVLLIIFASLVALIFSGWITKPITELRHAMKKVERGDFKDVCLTIKQNNEIGMLRRSFNLMTNEIQNLMKEKEQDQKLKYKLELKALQAQINPHFLYNTLDSIVWMAEIEENEKVVVMTSALARLLRQSINNEEQEVTIEQELACLESYLTIQKMRYQEQLEYKIIVDRAIYSVKIIKLILQPLVENALYHGIKYRETKGMICISGQEQDGKIILDISDNGIGMDKNMLSHIFEKKEKTLKSNGVGIENINKRIKLYYGKEYGLQYKSEKNKGTIVSVILPGGLEKNNEEKK